MPQTRHVASEPRFVPATKALSEQIADAVRSHATPLSHLLRLMAAVEAQGGDEALRLMLRARIGAPLNG